MEIEIIKTKPKKVNFFTIIFVCLVLGAIIYGVIRSFQAESKETISKEITNNEINDDVIEVNTNTIEEQKASLIKIPIIDEVASEKINNIYKSEIKRAFLTFDDGPSPNVTPLILDVLKENGIKATFFMLGNRVDTYPKIAKRVYEEGHYIGNHGYYHIYSKIYETPQSVLTEYEQCEYAIRTAIEQPEYTSRLFRFPGGLAGGPYAEIKKQATEILKQNNIAHVDWNCLTQDSAGKYTKEQLLQNLKDTAYGKNSIVILMHDAGDKILTYEMLQDAINYLREEGYIFCSFYDIMSFK